RLLAQLTRSGQSIGFLAGLPTEQLRRLSEEATASARVPALVDPSEMITRCVDAVRRLDARALESLFSAAETELGMQGMLQRLIGPLAETIGNEWRDGSLTAAHEHFASAVLRTLLGQAVRPFAGSENGPVIVIATPGGQLHELGALIAGALATNLGWRVIYLGASLPAAEIAGTARQHLARVVGLSLVYPEDDPRLDAELSRLRELLPADVRIVVGGRAAPAYQQTLTRIGATHVGTLPSFSAYLDEIRRPPG
ncbi:MAG TPA: cobalamin-dependent protein, partial [Opitutaceae bacterium]|nr:cobalamin-dependent protein [Opitutaceae bacterium]